jgi:hypothetical protein
MTSLMYNIYKTMYNTLAHIFVGVIMIYLHTKFHIPRHNKKILTLWRRNFLLYFNIPVYEM